MIMVFVQRANLENARHQVSLDIQSNANVLVQAVESHTKQLFESSTLLSSDFAFKRAFATQDRATILSAMQNHLNRLDSADVMLLLDIDDETVIANTLEPNHYGQRSSFSKLLAQADASDYGEASSFVLMQGEVYQFIVGFLFAPEPVAWIAIGFRVDDSYVEKFETLSLSYISLAYMERNQPRLFASALEAEQRQQLQQVLVKENALNQDLIMLGDQAYVTHVRPLADSVELPVYAVVQRSLTEAMLPYDQLRLVLIILFFIGLALMLLGGVYIARRIAQPIKQLTDCAERVQKGDFEGRVSVDRADEVGVLSQAFNHMLEGLEERDRVSSLLGKVVSPEIASELLEKGVELGGEEKEVTVLFSDIRDFTTLCEGQSATAVLSLLNAYLTEMSMIVEQHEGVVDKYIGDALMALFGAPIASDKSTTQAVRAGLAMLDGLKRVNQLFLQQGVSQVDIGIGINTDTVVVGNMGSKNRLNYTVIGDGVNLSSRLEGLTKFYGVKILVNETTRKRTVGIEYKEIDRVCVKGERSSGNHLPTPFSK
ncbi:MAG: adenylate/guanylate cyclase domain-containing protein [Ghiorsea sp.]|nr:adenylate/guanylate cyclase domain-containing protein [Ghiorsea sp.]